MATVDRGVEGSVERVQQLTEHLDAVADPGVRAIADELTTAVVQMYGAGLERMLGLVAERCESADAEALLDAFAADRVVAGLLLIHDLHPEPLEQRVLRALERVRPYMESHGGDVELLGVDDGVARLRLRGTCSSCRASTATLELAVRQALDDLCPDLEGMDVDGVIPVPEPVAGVPLPMAAPSAPAWHDVEGAGELPGGAIAGVEVDGVALVVADVEGTLLAYRDRCAACGGGLAGGTLEEATLTCAACGAAFALTRAGRSGDGKLQLEPVPLLRDGPRVRVALGGA